MVGNNENGEVTNSYYLTGTASAAIGGGVSADGAKEVTQDGLKDLASLLGDKWVIGENGRPVLRDNLEVPIWEDDGKDKGDGSGTTDSTAKRDDTRDSTRKDNYQIMQAVLKDLEEANNGNTAKVVTATTAAGATVSVIPVKLYSLNAVITRANMEVLASGSTGLKVDLDNGAAQVLIPAGFTMPKDGILAYHLGHQLDPLYSNIMKAKVKEPAAQTEVHLLGGGELPVGVTVTIKTKVKGPVNVYRWDDETWKIKFLTTGTAENGRVTFATKQLGNFIITTGTI